MAMAVQITAVLLVLLSVEVVISQDCLVDVEKTKTYSCTNSGSCDADIIYTWTLASTDDTSSTTTSAAQGFKNGTGTGKTVTMSQPSGGGFQSIYNLTDALHVDASFVIDDSIHRKLTCKFCDETKETTICSDITFYRQPQNVTCKASGPDAKGLVQVSCAGSGASHNMICAFYMRTDKETETKIPDDYVTQTETKETKDTYDLSCSASIPTNIMGLGSHTFQLEVYPDVTGGEKERKNFTIDEPFKFSLPEAVVTCSKEAKNGYVNARSVNCFCSANAPSDPSAKASWQIDSKDVTNLNKDGSLTFSFDKPERKAVCTVSSSLGTFAQPHIPNFAFLENDAWKIDASEKETDDGKNLTFQVTLDPSKSQPSAVITTSTNGNNETVEYLSTTVTEDHDEQGTNPKEQHVITYNIITGGIYEFTFNISNSIFRKNNYAATVTRTIGTAPKGYPKLSIKSTKGKIEMGQIEDGSQTITADEGSAADVTCEVFGAYPAIEVEINCGGKIAKGSDNKAEIKDLIIESENCTCTGIHATVRQKTSVIHIDIKKIVHITQFTTHAHLSDITSKLLLSEGDTPTLYCAAEGEGTIELSLQRLRTGKELKRMSSSDGKALVEFTFPKAECLDSDTYVCTAQNGVRVSRRNMRVYVTCPLRPADSIPNPLVIEVQHGSDANFHVDVTGYPYPTKITFEKAKSDTSGPADDQSVTVHSSEFIPPIFRVNITKKILTEGDYTDYRINLQNEEHEPLVINVKLEEKTEAPEVVGGSQSDSQVQPEPEATFSFGFVKLSETNLFIVLASLSFLVGLLVVIIVVCRVQHRRRMRPYKTKSSHYIVEKGYRNSMDLTAVNSAPTPRARQILETSNSHLTESSTDGPNKTYARPIKGAFLNPPDPNNSIINADRHNEAQVQNANVDYGSDDGETYYYSPSRSRSPSPPLPPPPIELQEGDAALELQPFENNIYGYIGPEEHAPSTEFGERVNPCVDDDEDESNVYDELPPPVHARANGLFLSNQSYSARTNQGYN